MAVLGSVLAGGYATPMTGVVHGLPTAAAAAARNLGDALTAARQLGGPAGEGLAAARAAFIHGLAVTELAGLAVTLAVAVVAPAFLPARAKPRPRDGAGSAHRTRLICSACCGRSTNWSTAQSRRSGAGWTVMAARGSVTERDHRGEVIGDCAPTRIARCRDTADVITCVRFARPPAPPFPEELWGREACGIVWCYTGSHDQADDVLEPVRTYGSPLLAGLQPMPFSVLQSAFDGLYPAGLQRYWRTDFFNEISDAAIDVHTKYGEKLPTGHSTMHLYPIDGAVSRVPADATAFVYRDGGWAGIIAGVDPDPANPGLICGRVAASHE